MKKAVLLIGAALLAFACAKPVDPELTINSQTDVAVSAAGETVTVEFTSNVPWNASLSVSDWATISPASGEAGTSRIKVAVLKNDNTDERSATLTINAIGEEATKTATVKLTQGQKNSVVAPGDAIEIDYKDQDISVKLSANVEYNIVSNASWIKVVKTKAMTEYTASLHVDKNKGDARTGTLTVSGDGVNAEITVKQGAFVPSFTISGLADDGYLYVGVDGGEATFSIETNMDWEITTYDVFDWAPFSGADGKYKFTVAKNNGYDTRTAYVKFTTSDIKDEVLDDYGEPTGEYADHVERIYVIQEGRIQQGWRTEFLWDLYSYGGHFSTAIAGKFLLVCNAYSEGIHYFDKATGAYGGLLPLPFVPSAITNDDAGNIIATVGGNYPIDEETWGLIEEDQVPYEIYYLPAGNLDVTAVKQLVSYYDGFYGYGLDNIRVSGDVTKEAVMVASSAGYGTSYAVAWQVTDGAVADPNSITDYVTFYSGDAVWASSNIVNYPLGSKMSDGIYGAGYATVDGTLDVGGTYYGICYNPGTWAMTDWQFLGEFNQSWANAITNMDIITWNGHKYMVASCLSYFAYADWDYDGTVDQLMPCYLFLVNIDNPAAPEVVSCSEYYASLDNWQYGDSADVIAEVKNGDLVVYIVDAAASHIQQKIFPAL